MKEFMIELKMILYDFFCAIRCLLCGKFIGHKYKESSDYHKEKECKICKVYCASFEWLEEQRLIAIEHGEELKKLYASGHFNKS